MSSRGNDSEDNPDDQGDSRDSRSRSSRRSSSSSRSGGGAKSFSTGGGGGKSGGSAPEVPPLVFGTKYERDGVHPRGTLISESSFKALPCTRQPVEANGTTYFRCGDSWYQSIEQEGWTVYSEIWPPAGAAVSTIPDDHMTVQSAGRTLYATDHAWYERSPAGSYVVVEPPVGLPIDHLPESAKHGIPVVVNGVTYYRHLGVFYKEEGDGAASHYVVAKSPYDDMPSFLGQSSSRSGSSSHAGTGLGAARAGTSASKPASHMAPAAASRSSTSTRYQSR